MSIVKRTTPAAQDSSRVNDELRGWRWRPQPIHGDSRRVYGRA